MHISTARLNIRPIRLEDATAILDYRSDPEVSKYQSWVPNSIEDVRQFILKNPQEVNIVDSWFQVVLSHKETGQIIGDLGIHFVGSHQVELGCTLCKEAQQKGMAKESIESIAYYLFESLSKHRIYVCLLYTSPSPRDS